MGFNAFGWAYFGRGFALTTPVPSTATSFGVGILALAEELGW